jgi:8-amino-7-oxononanoate synthase
MANLGVLSSLPQENDIILYDELIHNSCHEGMRLSRAYTKGNSFAFRHNDVTSLLSLLTSKHTTLKGNGIIYVVVESLYSMDGDIAPLKEMALLSEEFGAFLIVDEAHSVGVYGPHGSGILCEIGIDAFPNVIAARVYTFGKAMGCHGAVVCGSKNLIEYLVNYARSVIYTTAPSFDQLVTIECIHEYCAKADDTRQKLREIVSYFKENIQQNLQIPKHVLVPSDSAIQGIFFQGNHQILAAAKYMNQKGIQIIPIRSPTVPKGMERFRIVLHAHNTKAQVDQLINTIAKLFENETIAKL